MEMPKLTQFSPGAGCGCKISPRDLAKILAVDDHGFCDSKLLVGNRSKDDAAVYDLGTGQAIISTTDFFTPIVDDPFDFGRIAATNAISDVYAMGGTPFLAIAVLGWPLSKLPAELAKEVINGARQVCNDLGVSLAGGHSIDISDPVFGLAVNGTVKISNIKRNDTAKPGCKLFLSKPLGIGIFTTAGKKSLLREQDKKTATELMCRANRLGAGLGHLDAVTAMTDVTGFGLLGHLLEICEGSNVNARVMYDRVPKMEGIEYYIDKKSFPGGSFRNWTSYGEKIVPLPDDRKMLLCDPQTSGGLLIAVAPEGLKEFHRIAEQFCLKLEEIGELTERANEMDAFIQIV